MLSVLKLRGSPCEIAAVRGHERTSLFIKRGRRSSLKSGSIFSRKHNDSSVETARIISMRTDTFGIAHVSYEAVSRAAYRRLVF